jgi:hypothetical protein
MEVNETETETVAPLGVCTGWSRHHGGTISSTLVGMADQPAPGAVTDEERARVRAEVREKLAAAAARHTPEYWARLREQLGLPPKAA